MLDAVEGVTDQDASVLGAVLDAGRALVVAINKWDGLTDYQREQTEALLVAQARLRRLGRSGAHLRQARLGPARAVQGDPSRACVGDAASSAPAKSPRRWRSPTRPTRRRSCAATWPSCASRIRAARIRRPSSSTARACARCRTATSATSRTSSASASSWSARRCASSSRKAKPVQGKKNVLTERQVAKKRRLIRHVKTRQVSRPRTNGRSRRHARSPSASLPVGAPRAWAAGQSLDRARRHSAGAAMARRFERETAASIVSANRDPHATRRQACTRSPDRIAATSAPSAAWRRWRRPAQRRGC